jgi:hypothetical protein
MASGLLVDAWVRLPRLSPPKSVSLFRPPLAGDSTGARLRLEALHAGPGFHQSAVCREVIRQEKLLHVGLGQDRGHELGRDIAFEQSVPVLGEHRVIPDRIVDANPDEPAAQQFELQPFDQLVFRADCVRQLLRRDRGPSQRRVHRRRVGTQVRQCAIHNLVDRTQRRVRRARSGLRIGLCWFAR